MITGRTRLYVILGDPIAKVRSPEAFNRAFERHGIDAVLVPLECAPADLAATVAGLKRVRNLDGLIFTMPHKALALALIDEASDAARLVGAINAARRDAGGHWRGDMFDGQGFVRGLRRRGQEPRGRRAALLGAGGAGRAIAFALAQAGVTAISIHDLEPAKAIALAADLSNAYRALGPRAGPPRAGEFDLLVNATPTGMKPDDPLPWPVAGLATGTIVGDVTTKPEITPFLAAATERGYAVVSGRDMVEGQLGALFGFFGFDVDPLA
ncbi:MAG TPA: shikimate dehydrogenase [Burkholderiales bacterium]|nr:shikimate dehydrogenase [Burkholderiales bacterium]